MICEEKKTDEPADDAFYDTGGSFSECPVAPSVPLTKSPLLAAKFEPMESNHVIIISSPATKNMAGHASRILTNLNIKGVGAQSIMEIEMTERGDRALIIASVSYEVLDKGIQKKLPKKLKKSVRDSINLYFKTGEMIDGNVASGKVDVLVHKHYEKFIFRSSAMFSSKPVLAFSFKGPGGSGQLASIIEVVKLCCNQNTNVVDLYGRQHSDDESTIEVYIQLLEFKGESQHELAGAIEQKLAVKLPEYQVSVTVVESHLTLFGRDVIKSASSFVEM